MKLPARLDGVLALLRPCVLLADVGTDHGLLPIAAVTRGLAERAIAADLRTEPLRGARANVARAAVEERVRVLQSNGLAKLQDASIDAVTMAGMSGTLMARLLEAVPASVAQLVLQPNTHAEDVRAWARRSGWTLHDERMLEQRGRFFVVCAFERGATTALPGELEPEALDRLGPLLLARRDPVAARWFRAQRDRIRALARSSPRLERELAWWQAACDATDP